MVLALAVHGTAQAQVFNYEPYDDSDLLGDFERPRKLHFGMNINVGKAGGASSVFYNGTGTGELGDVFRELISIPERLDWNSVAGGSGNTAQQQIAQVLVADAGAMSVASIQSTNVTMSASASVCASCSGSIWRTPLPSIWTFGAQEPGRQWNRAASRPRAGRPTFGTLVFSPRGPHAVRLGYRTASPIDQSALDIRGGGKLDATRIRQHYIGGANTYDLSSPAMARFSVRNAGFDLGRGLWAMSESDGSLPRCGPDWNWRMSGVRWNCHRARITGSSTTASVPWLFPRPRRPRLVLNATDAGCAIFAPPSWKSSTLSAGDPEKKKYYLRFFSRRLGRTGNLKLMWDDRSPSGPFCTS